MYNLGHHYQNIYALAKSIIAEPTVVCLHPFGSTGIENVETIGSSYDPRLDNISFNDIKIGVHSRTGPVLVCYDQEPLLSVFNRNLFVHIKQEHAWLNSELDLVEAKFQFKLHNQPVPEIYSSKRQKVILLNTELDSDEKDRILSEHEFIDCYYFHHIFAAHDWFRGYRYCTELVPPADRQLTKKYITFNRLTSEARVYRSLLINELIKHNLLDQGYVSYNDVCPNGGSYKENLRNNQYRIPTQLIEKAIANIDRIDKPLRIDYADQQFIPNHSFELGAIPESMQSFLHVVTETCYWGRKKHLTEKIFKPIIMRQPFLLVGCAHNLAYLKSYGFRTFDRWFDESYDAVENDIDRMQAISSVLQKICSYSLSELKDMLCEMQEVLDYNYNLFYSQEFLDRAWNELADNLRNAITNKQ